MGEQETTACSLEGLNARPGAEFVRMAKGVSSEVMVCNEEIEANVKSSLKLVTLGTKHGDKILVRAEGGDAEKAANALVKRPSAEE